MTGTFQLCVAAGLSFTASLLHVAIIFGGASWYRFFGAGETMAKLSESGSYYPAGLTTGIALVLCIFGLYALSGAGVFPRLPFTRTALTLITVIYLGRGVAGLTLPFFIDHPALSQNSITFWLISSSICTLFGLFYLFGTIASWSRPG